MAVDEAFRQALDLSGGEEKMALIVGLCAALGVILCLAFLLINSQGRRKVEQAELEEAQEQLEILKNRFKQVLDIEEEIQKLKNARSSAEAELKKIHGIVEIEKATQKALFEKEQSNIDQALRQRREDGERQVVAELAQKIQQRRNLDEEISKRRGAWENQISETMAALSELNNLVEETSEEAEIQSFGMYKPRFEFATVEGYKDRLDEIRTKQRAMIKEKKAANCSTKWEVSGSVGAQLKVRVSRQCRKTRQSKAPQEAGHRRLVKIARLGRCRVGSGLLAPATNTAPLVAVAA